MAAITPANYQATRTTLGAIDVSQLVTLPVGCEYCLIQFIANDGKIATAILADAAAIGAAYLTAPANTWVPMPCKGLRQLSLASGVAAVVVETMPIPSGG